MFLTDWTDRTWSPDDPRLSSSNGNPDAFICDWIINCATPLIVLFNPSNPIELIVVGRSS